MDELMRYGYKNMLKQAQLLLIEVSWNGLRVDMEYVIKLEKDFGKRISAYAERFKQLVGEEINLNSPKQVLNCLLSRGIDVKSTDKRVLQEYINKDEFVKLLFEYRELETVYDRCIAPILTKHVREGNLVHTKFSLTTARTGRVASYDPNMQNVPNKFGPDIERMFVSRFENGYMLKADYSMMELRVAAMYSNDQKMIECFKTGVDIHSKVAMDIYGISAEDIKNKTKDAIKARQVAKGFNFGLIYGRSSYSIARELGIELDAADVIKNKYFNNFSGLRDWLDRTRKEVASNGYVRNMFGRIRFLPEVFSLDKGIREGGLRKGVNTPIQGAASDIALLGLKNCRDEIKKRGLKTLLVNTVHDSGIFDLPREELEEVISIIKKKAVQVKLPIKTEVPLGIDVAWGKSWGDCK